MHPLASHAYPLLATRPRAALPLTATTAGWRMNSTDATTIKTEQPPPAPSPLATGTTSSSVHQPGRRQLHPPAQLPPPLPTRPIATSSTLPVGDRVSERELLHLWSPSAPSTNPIAASTVYWAGRRLQHPSRRLQRE
jgi:hypothetical protein